MEKLDFFNKDTILCHINDENYKLVKKIYNIIYTSNENESNSILDLLNYWDNYSEKKIIEQTKEPKDLCRLIELCKKYNGEKESVQKTYIIETIKVQAKILLLRYNYCIQNEESKFHKNNNNEESKLKEYQNILKNDDSFFDKNNNKIKITFDNTSNDQNLKNDFEESLKFIEKFLEKFSEEENNYNNEEFNNKYEKESEDILEKLSFIDNNLPEDKKIRSIQQILNQNTGLDLTELNYFLFQNYMKDIYYCGFQYNREWEWKTDKGDDNNGFSLFRNVNASKGNNNNSNNNNNFNFNYVKNMLKESSNHIAGKDNSLWLFSYSKDFLLDIYKYAKIYPFNYYSSRINNILYLGIESLDKENVDIVETNPSSSIGEIKIGFVKGAIANVIKVNGEEKDFYKYMGSINQSKETEGFCIEPFYKEQYIHKYGRKLYNYQNYLKQWIDEEISFPVNIADNKDEEIVTTPSYFKILNGWEELDNDFEKNIEYQFDFNMEEFLYFLYCINLSKNKNSNVIENEIKKTIKDKLLYPYLYQYSIEDFIKNNNINNSTNIEILGYQIFLRKNKNFMSKLKIEEKDIKEGIYSILVDKIFDKISEIICNRIVSNKKHISIKKLVESKFIQDAITKSIEKYKNIGLYKNSIYRQEYDNLSEWKQLFLKDLLNLKDKA